MATKSNSPALALELAKVGDIPAVSSPFRSCWSWAVVLIDGAIALGSYGLAFWSTQHAEIFVRYESDGMPVGWTNAFQPYAILLLFVPLIRLAALKHYDLYRLRGEFSLLHDLTGVFLATSVGSISVMMLAFLSRGGFGPYSSPFAREVFLADWVVALSVSSLFRMAVRGAQTAVRYRDRNLIPAIVVGNGHLASLCLSEIQGKPRLGYRLLGAVVADEEEEACEQVDEVPVLGRFSDLPAIIRESKAQEVFITDPRISSQTLFETIMRCGRNHHVEFRVVPTLFNCLPKKTELGQIGSLPMIKLFQPALHGPARFIKRSIDLAATSLLLVVSAPLWITLMILIKLDSKGPVFYKQERVGMDGHVFLMLKFRSMRSDSDDKIHQEIMKKVIRNEMEANQGDDETPVYGKVKDDPRITRVGKFIRKYSLDEVPQLFNVIAGQMSLVGPRPPIAYEAEEYEEWHRARFSVTPGITGLWQVSGRNKLTFTEMVKLDVYYIENWSVWLDLKILLKTPNAVLKGENAY